MTESWWGPGATERCSHCEQRYVYELEYRCFACDAPLCPFCVVVVRERREASCPRCTEAA